MLSLTNRLKKKKDFEKVFKQGKSFQEDGLAVRIKTGEGRYSRFGFVVSNKVSKKAVARNRIRRQLHEVARKLLPELKRNIDAVFIVRPGFANRRFADIENTARRLFRRAEAIAT